MRIESLLSARLSIAPQRVGERIYFISDLSGRLSLCAMDARPGGSVPEPLLPPHIALQNPHLVGGYAFHVFHKLGKILLMIDRDGDENYQPMQIPVDGGFPEPAFGDRFANYRVHMGKADAGRSLVYLLAESRTEQMNEAYRGSLETGELEKLGQSPWGSYPDGHNADHGKVTLIDGYTFGDNVVYLWTREAGERRLLYGTPLEARVKGETYPLNAISNCQFTTGDRGLLCVTGLFEDSYGLGYMRLDGGSRPPEVRRVNITGAAHTGAGELTGLDHLKQERYEISYNIDGSSWLYEGEFDEEKLEMRLVRVVCGQGQLSGGVLESARYDEAGDRHALSFSTATSPTQIYSAAPSGAGRTAHTVHTRERVLGIPAEWLSPGQDASFTSYDGMRISARLYRPAPALEFEGRRPLIYYIHGGPQGQERPDFAWFSMPLIQFLALNGFAVFVPNVRGSTGYGLKYMKWVDRDWGGHDRLDHVHAMTAVLPQDSGLDVSRAGVVGRSYGGYMTLTLASRHPELWSAAVDMFGPYSLHDFMNRLPETWKPYFSIAVGHPEKDRDFLVERSPSTYIQNIACPLLVIQGKNDPRVIERESRDVVERLRAAGKEVAYLVFEDEGHDVLKFPNKVRCYSAILSFFQHHLGTNQRDG